MLKYENKAEKTRPRVSSFVIWALIMSLFRFDTAKLASLVKPYGKHYQMPQSLLWGSFIGHSCFVIRHFPRQDLLLAP